MTITISPLTPSPPALLSTPPERYISSIGIINRLSRKTSASLAAEIPVGDIVDYAQRISGITSAPSYWKPGMAMVGFAPPAPRPEMMRAGALSAFAANTGRLISP